MSDPLIYIGIDFETTGTDFETSVPIEFGMATEWGNVHERLIGGWDWNDRPWSAEAEGIHKISQDDLRLARPADWIDKDFVDWVHLMVGADPKRIIAVGWNVASFDLPFLRRYLPQTSKAISYRTVDLNAIVFAIVEAELRDAYGEPWTYYGLKDHLKREAADRIEGETGTDQAWHRAGYDALASIYAFDELLDILRRSSR